MAGEYDFKSIKQGETFSRVLTYRDSAGALVNLTGYTAAMPVRRSQGQGTSPQPTLALSGVLGTIRFTFTAAQTSAMQAGIYDYDIFLTAPDSTVTCLLTGRLEVERAVSAT